MSFPAYPNYQNSGVGWLGEVPSHWNLRRLGGLFTERREKVSDTEFPPLSVTKLGIVPQLETAAKTDDNDNRKCVRAGDFVINSRSDRKGSAGLSRLDGSVSLINTVITPDEILEPTFVHYLLRSAAFQEEYYRYGKGIVADLWSTNYSEMKNILLAYPERPEQKAIAAFLDRETVKIDALIEEQRRLIALLKEKRQAVVSHAVTKGLDPHAPMKDSGIEWLGEVPAHWDVLPLKRVASVLAGYAFAANNFSLDPQNWRLLRGINLSPSGIRWSGDTVFWERTPDDGLEPWELRAGDVVLGMDRPWIGDGLRLAKVSKSDLPSLLLQRVAAVRAECPSAQAFILHCLRHEAFFHHCAPEMTGVSVPHISGGQIEEFRLPLPPANEMSAISSEIERRTSEFEAVIETASAAVELLTERRAALISAAVTGKIDVRQTGEVLKFPIDRARARSLVATEIIERSSHQPTFGRVKFQKIAFLAEGHVGISELAGAYLREAAGPLDRTLIDDMQEGARTIAGIASEQPEGQGTTVTYRLTQPRGAHRQELTDWLGEDRIAKLDKLIANFADLNTKGAEAVATLYAVWNDALMDGASPSDDEIIAGFLNDWHPEKRKKFRADELPVWLDWMRRHAIVPTGSGPKTTTGRLFI